jgi:hypothetical protein
MYAICTNPEGVNFFLEYGKEYKVVSIIGRESNYADTFYLLEDGLAYASCHFSVTYEKQSEIL